MEEKAMNEINVLKDHLSILDDTKDAIGGVLEILYDLENLLEPLDGDGMAAVKEMITSATVSICQVDNKLIRQLTDEAQDHRTEYLDNLRGYFNTETGTWYEQAKTAYRRLTGLPGNEWNVLAWTATLFRGGSTLRYLIDSDQVIKQEDGSFRLCDTWQKQYGCDAVSSDACFKIDSERIAYLYKNNFDDLRIPLNLSLSNLAGYVNESRRNQNKKRQSSQELIQHC